MRKTVRLRLVFGHVRTSHSFHYWQHLPPHDCHKVRTV